MARLVIEKRKSARYKFEDGAFVDLQKPTFFNFIKPKIHRFGSVVNLSNGGVSVCYNGNELDTKGVKRLNLSFPNFNFQIENIPFKTITDYPTTTSSNTKSKRTCGLEFDKINDKQKNLLA
jgi:hypothetical protein